MHTDPERFLKILSMGGTGSIAVAGLGKQEVVLNMIYAEKSPGKEGNVYFLLEEEVIPLGLNLSPIGSSLNPNFVSLVLRHHVAGIIFLFNKSFLTCSSSQQAPVLEAITQQPHFPFLYFVTLTYLIKEWINMDACSPALLFLGEEAISSISTRLDFKNLIKISLGI